MLIWKKYYLFSNPAELHVKNNQIEINQNNNVCLIPLEDISQIICLGQNIRISTMAMVKLSEHNIILTSLNNKYLPSAIVIPFEGNNRQSKIIHIQIQDH